jgi:hypothetical protein
MSKFFPVERKHDQTDGVIAKCVKYLNMPFAVEAHTSERRCLTHGLGRILPPVSSPFLHHVTGPSSEFLNKILLR